MHFVINNLTNMIRWLWTWACELLGGLHLNFFFLGSNTILISTMLGYIDTCKAYIIVVYMRVSLPSLPSPPRSKKLSHEN